MPRRNRNVRTTAIDADALADQAAGLAADLGALDGRQLGCWQSTLFDPARVTREAVTRHAR